MLVYVGQQRINPRPLDLNTLITDLRGLLEDRIGPDTTLVIHREEQPLVCAVDSSQIREMMPGKGGRISIRTGRSDIQGLVCPAPFRDVDLSAKTYVCCEITDNGGGMDKEISDHIFEPFFSTKFTGRGLGLSIVAGILKAHQGTMTVQSIPGRGTTIRFFLPEVR